MAAAAPFAGIIATEQFAAGVVHAGQTSSLMGRHLFAKAALLDAPPAPPAADSLEDGAAIETSNDDYAPIRALLGRGAPRRARGADHQLRDVPAGAVRRTIAQPDARSGGTGSNRDHGRASALRRILRAPLEFARLAALHYQSLWTVDRLRHPGTAPALTQFIAEQPAAALRG